MIAHVDADSFFASVLQRLHPHLRGKPLFALGMHGTFIIAASYEAKAKGVRTGMSIKEARERCPGAMEMASDFRETGLASQQIESVLRDTCPIIEQMSIDEWYIDMASCVGGPPKDPVTWATDLQKRIAHDVGLSVSIGVASTKLLAKLAGETKKPAGVTVIHPTQIDAFLSNRPMEAICGMGSRRCIPAKARGWSTAYDIAHAPSDVLLQLYGRPGLDLQQELQGVIRDPVNAIEAAPKSISRCRSMRKTDDESIVWGMLLEHLAITVRRMRSHTFACGFISVWVRDSDYHYHGTHLRLPMATDTERELLPSVRHCWRKLLRPGRRYTQVGIALSDFSPVSVQQYSLFEAPKVTDSGKALQSAMDTVRKKFGKGIIMSGAALNVTDQSRPELGIEIIEN